MTNINKDITPLVIGIALMLISLIVVSTSNYVLNFSHYIGLVTLMILTILYFTNRKFYIIGLGMILVVGLFGLINFFYADFKIGFGEFGINPLFIVLIFIYFMFCKESMNKYFPEKFKD